MRNKQNKHGPDIDVGTRRVLPFARSDTAAGVSEPDVGIPETDIGALEKLAVPMQGKWPCHLHTPVFKWPPGNSRSHNRILERLQATIAEGRPGESPPGSVDDWNWIYIDSKSLIKGICRGRNLQREQTIDWHVMGELCPRPPAEPEEYCISFQDIVTYSTESSQHFQADKSGCKQESRFKEIGLRNSFIPEDRVYRFKSRKSLQNI